MIDELKTTAEFLGYKYYSYKEVGGVETYRYKEDVLNELVGDIDLIDRSEDPVEQFVYRYWFDQYKPNPLSVWLPHKDWNHLMEIVAAIENLWTNNGFRPRVTISTNFCRIDKIENRYEDDTEESKKLGILQTCAQFIKQIEEWKKQ